MRSSRGPSGPNEFGYSATSRSTGGSYPVARGAVAERLGRGLQSLPQRFESARRLSARQKYLLGVEFRSVAFELETNADRAVHDDVCERQRGGEHDERRGEARMLERVLQFGANDVGDPARMDERIPAVEAEKSAEVDTEARQCKCTDDAEPRHCSACRPFPDRLHHVQRSKAEDESRPRDRGEHQRVVPERCRDRLVQVDEVRQQVRRVREKEQPEHAEDDDERPASAPRRRVCEEREHERDPSEDEVPDEEVIERVTRVVAAVDDEENAEGGCGEERRDRQRAAARQYGRTAPT